MLFSSIVVARSVRPSLTGSWLLRRNLHHNHSHPSPHPTRSTRLRNFTLISALSLTTYTLGSFYPPTPVTILSPRSAPPNPPPDSPAAQAHIAALELNLQSLPLLRNLRSAPDANEWYEARPYATLPPSRLRHSLTGSSLRGPGRLAIPPLVRAKKDESESIVIVHVGHELCGHEGIVHGGLLATLFDEILARNAINSFPEKIGVTANLSVNYQKPTRADQFLVFRSHVEELQARRCRVKGTVETIDGEKLAESTALYALPKYASLLNTDMIQQVMGLPQPSPPPTANIQNGQQETPQ